MNGPRGHLTCPRCKRSCSYLVTPYWESPWRDQGGLCGICCEHAAEKFDADNKWPDFPPDQAVAAVVQLDGGPAPTAAALDGGRTSGGRLSGEPSPRGRSRLDDESRDTVSPMSGR